MIVLDSERDAVTLPGKERGERTEAIDAAAVMDHGIATVRFDDPTHGVAGVGLFRILAHLRYDHLWRVHLLHLLFRNDLSIFVFTPVQVHQDPVAQLRNIGDNRPSWSDGGLCSVKGDLFDLVLYLFVGMGVVAGFPGCLHNVEIATLHLQESEDVLPHKLFPGLPGESFYQQASRHIHQILVLPETAKVLRWLQVLQTKDLRDRKSTRLNSSHT